MQNQQQFVAKAVQIKNGLYFLWGCMQEKMVFQKDFFLFMSICFQTFFYDYSSLIINVFVQKQ